MRKTLLLTTLLILCHMAPAQSFDYTGNGSGDLGLRSQVVRPLARHMPLIFNFTMTVLAITAMVGAGKIYTRWQEGTEDVTSMILRWFMGVVLVFALMYFLKQWAAGNPALPVAPDLNF